MFSFSSFLFWVTFPVIFLLYWLIPAGRISARKFFLLLVSYAIYLSWRPTAILILFLVTGITFLGARIIGAREDEKRKAICILFSILAILPLLLFKYGWFITENLSYLFSVIGLNWQPAGLNWFIPIGISFFTFQALGYMLDVYHRRCHVENNILNHSLFVAFFPQIVSGPISKAQELTPQLDAERHFDSEDAICGLKTIIWGMFFKFAVADRVGMFADAVFRHPDSYTGLTVLLGILMYSIQIYADFAGYSWMAIGTARMLGIRLADNFRRPYLAISITDFWRRWHISLSRWLKDYIYIPLGGNRCSKGRNYMNIAITFLVSGIWHGAAWTFILWGLLHGLVQIVEKMLGIQRLKEGDAVLVRMLRILVTFCIVTVGWALFRSYSIGAFFSLVSRIFTIPGPLILPNIGGATIFMWITGVLILIAKDLKDEYLVRHFSVRKSLLVHVLAYAILFCIVIGIGVFDGGQFIYGNF